MPKRGRKKSLPLQKLEAVISRLLPQHPKLPMIRIEAQNYQKGFEGERKLDYYLQSLPQQFAILNDITLTIFSKQFQIDSLIINAHAIFIIEVKNFEGPVTFDMIQNQFIKGDGEKIRGYKHPLIQVETIHHHLQSWLQKRNLTGLPIYYFIAFAERSTVYHVTGDVEPIRKVVSYADEIPLRLMKNEDYLARNTSENNQLKNRIIQAIMRECEDFDYDVVEKLGVRKKDILPGVHCPICGTLGMERLNRRWSCTKCNAISRNAHLKALYHHAILIDQKIRNEQCRNFLLLNTRHEAHNILKSSSCTLKKGSKMWLIPFNVQG